MKKLQFFSFAALFMAATGIFFTACSKDEATAPSVKENTSPDMVQLVLITGKKLVGIM